MNNYIADFASFNFGYAVYSAIELSFRKYTHYSMGIAGGICFLSIHKLYKKYKGLSLFKKCVIGSAVITFIEFVFGIIFNKLLKRNVWDYSDMPFNIMGQICPLFSVLWALLCIPICYLSKKIEKLENKARQ